MQLILTINDKQIAAFSEYLRLKERSSETIKQYQRSLRMLQSFLGRKQINRENLIAWKNSLIADSFSPAYVNTKLAAVNSYLRWKNRPGLCMRLITVEKTMFRSDARSLTKEEFHKLVRTAEERGRHRLAVMLMTLGGTGIRISELKYITVEAAKDRRADVELKGTHRQILIPRTLSVRLLEYAKSQDIRSGPIFITSSGQELDRKQAWAEMKSICSFAGVAPAKVYPHNLRHLFACLHFKKYRDFALLASTLGHKSIETTRIYLNASLSEAMKKIDDLGIVD